MAHQKSSFKGIGLYIHFPFCVKKCLYCDFVSYPVRVPNFREYFSYLKKEIEIFLKRFPINSTLHIETLYIGGGTPSLINGVDLKDLVNFLKGHFDFSHLSEFTVEANPESIERTRFEIFKQIGVNRVSIGAQSFNDKTLKILGRSHYGSDVEEKFYLLRDMGFDNINLDLIFALPDEDFDMQKYSLKKAISLHPEHISYYALMLERGTLLNRIRKQYKFIDEDIWVKEFEEGEEMLQENGYIHYEISNYAKKGFECRHNMKYWRSLPYLGFGVSAGGFFHNVRYVNVKHLENYYKKIDQGKLPYSFKRKLEGKALKSEYVFMGLRLLEGIDPADYYMRFGSFFEDDFGKEVGKLQKLGLIKIKDNIALTKKGIRFSNIVFREFI